MSAEDVHIVRADVPQPSHAAREVLCGFETPKDGNRVSGPPNMATCWRCILLACGRPIPPEPAVTEHERLEATKKTDDATQLVGEFIDWLSEEKQLVLGRWNDDDELIPARENIQRLLAEYFGIDQNALEAEKTALLGYLRETHQAREWAMTEGKKTLSHAGE